jgi:PPR repeat
LKYNVVINSLAKSGGKEAAEEADRLLDRMHQLSHAGDPDVRPNVVTYGAVIDAYAKSGEKGAAARADALLAKMIQLYQMDPVANANLRPNTYVFNTVINAHAKSKEVSLEKVVPSFFPAFLSHTTLLSNPARCCIQGRRDAARNESSQFTRNAKSETRCFHVYCSY